MHWVAIIILFFFYISLSDEVRRVECKANGLEWAIGNMGGYCRTPLAKHGDVAPEGRVR